jgi:citrate lyase subunit beta/citryl-CoA lyase
MTSDSTPGRKAPNGASGRSFLFTPGDRPERFDKAWLSDADEVILDLEDAVAPHAKAAAREAIANWLHPRRPVWLRVNPVGSPWFEADLKLAAREGVAGVMLAKAEGPVPQLSSLCASRGMAWLPLVETAQGLRRAGEIAALPGVSRLAFGSIDFQVDLGIEDEEDGLLAFRSELVLQSRLAGIAAPLDGVTVAIGDDQALAAAARRSRSLGFGGKLCIHPRQATVVNEAFSPSPQQRDWARRVLDAMAASGGAAVAVDGKMVDRPVWLQAQRIERAPGPAPVRLSRA